MTSQHGRDANGLLLIVPHRTLRGARAGSTSIEYAVLIAAGIAVLVVVLGTLGFVSNSAFSNVGSRMITGNLSESSTGPQVAQTSSPALQRIPEPSSFDGAVRQWWPTALGTSVGVNVVLWGFIYIRRKRRRKTIPAKRVVSEIKEADLDSIFEKRQAIHRFLAENRRLLFEEGLLVQHIMSRNVIKVPPNMPVAEVVRIMRQHHIRQVLVCDAAGALLGVVSGRDMRGREARVASEVMIIQPFTVEPDALLGPAMTLLVKQRATFLPVVKDGRLVGVLSSTDLVMAFHCALLVLQSLKPQVEGVVADRKSLTISDIVARQTAQQCVGSPG